MTNARLVRRKLRNPPAAVFDDGIDLKRLPKGFHLAQKYILIAAAPPLIDPPRRPRKSRRRKPTSRSIIRTVATYYKTSPADIIGPARHMPLVRNRQVAAYLCREVLPLFYTEKSRRFSYPTLARRFHRDHSTIFSAFEAIACRLPRDPDLAWDVAHLEAALVEGRAP